MTLHPASDAIATEVQGGMVVLNVRTKRYYSLNETGVTVWRALEEGSDRTGLLSRLVASYAVSADDAGHALDRLLAELSAESLIEERA